MRLIVAANARVPSEKAHVFQTVQMCAAFAEAGAAVTLAHPRRRNRETRDAWQYYGLRPSFELRALPCVDVFAALERGPLAGAGSRVAFWLQAGSFAVSLAGYLRRAEADLIYTRDVTALAAMLLLPFRLRRKVIFEAHTLPGSAAGRALHRAALREARGVVAITAGLREALLGLGLPPRQVWVAPDGVDARRYEGISREVARARLGFAPQQKVVMYTGHLYQWKGAEVLAEAGGQLGEDVHTVIVGGAESEVSRLKGLCSQRGWTQVRVVGHVSPSEIPFYQIAADVLALPNSARAEISRTHTSPLKLFEYMAAGRPIVASDLPSLREVLRDGENALLVAPDDAAALAGGLRRVLADEALGDRLAAQARRDVKAYTWEKRAEMITQLMKARAG